MDAVEAVVRAWEGRKQESTQKLFGNDKQKQNDNVKERNLNSKDARKYLDPPTSVFPQKQVTSEPVAPIPDLNPYPPSSSPSIPVHFNAKGEFIFPYPTIPTPAQMIAPHSIRMCMRFGCGSILTPRNSADEDVFCARCRPLAAVGQFPKTVKPRRAFDVDVPITSMKRREVVGKSKDSPIVIPDDVTSAPMPDDLSYPEPEVTVRKDGEQAPIATPTVPTVVSIPEAPTIPRLPRPPLPKKKKTAPAPLRSCATPTCHGLIHASSSAHRCPPCVMKDWKNRIFGKGKERERKERVGIIVIPAKRKREAYQALEPAAPSVSVPSTPAPSLEKESISGWDSDLTDLSSSDEEALFEGANRRRMDESGHSGDTTSEDDEPLSQATRQVRPPVQPVRLVIRIPPRSPEKVAAASSPVASSSSTPGPPKKCAINACGALLDQEYTWKCCKACRKHHREYQRKRLGITKGTYNTDKDKISPSQSKPAIPNLPPGYRICTIRNCGTVIPPVEAYKWKMCKECRQRTKMQRRRRQEGAVEVAADKPHRREPRKPVYPEYASLLQLLNDYQQRIRGFFEAQAEWIIMKHRQENERGNDSRKDNGVDKHSSTADQQDIWSSRQENTTAKEGELFAFDGEYSVVAMDYAICDRQAAVIDFVGRLRGEIERVGGVAFDPKTRLVNLAYGGILTRYRCVHRIHVTLHDRTEKNDDIRIVKDMHGELEIAILPEYSHPLFPGQRTVARMRLMG